MSNLTGAEIVSISKIGQLSNNLKFMDGRSIADYKSMLATICDRAIAVIPAAVGQMGKDNTKSQLESMFFVAAKKNWNGSTNYWTTLNGNRAITQVERWQLADVARILCNIVDTTH